MPIPIAWNSINLVWKHVQRGVVVVIALGRWCPPTSWVEWHNMKWWWSLIRLNINLIFDLWNAMNLLAGEHSHNRLCQGRRVRNAGILSRCETVSFYSFQYLLLFFFHHHVTAILLVGSTHFQCVHWILAVALWKFWLPFFFIFTIRKHIYFSI